MLCSGILSLHLHSLTMTKQHRGKQIRGGNQALETLLPSVWLLQPPNTPPPQSLFTFQADVTVYLPMGDNNGACNRCSSHPMVHGRQESFTHFHLASGKLLPPCLEHTRVSGSASNPTPVAVCVLQTHNPSTLSFIAQHTVHNINQPYYKPYHLSQNINT